MIINQNFYIFNLSFSHQLMCFFSHYHKINVWAFKMSRVEYWGCASGKCPNLWGKKTQFVFPFALNTGGGCLWLAHMLTNHEVVMKITYDMTISRYHPW